MISPTLSDNFRCWAALSRVRSSYKTTLFKGVCLHVRVYVCIYVCLVVCVMYVIYIYVLYTTRAMHGVYVPYVMLLYAGCNACM